MSAIVFLLFSEVGKCILSKFSGSINDDHSIYSGSSSIVEMKPVRSLLDCVDQCMAERLCHGSFYISPQRSDLTGNCTMILNNIHTGTGRKFGI